MNKSSAALVLIIVGLVVYGVAHTPTQPGAQTPASVSLYNESDDKPRCNPNYSGCLKPDASDYDCAGGSGNGPYYTGPVRVIGYDQYGLDRDGDGWACE
jgi:hypothetical protein